jgi:hypothetical protein
MCVGAGGKVIVADVSRMYTVAEAAPPTGSFESRERYNKTMLLEYASLSAFTGYATNGLDEGYITVQIDRVNYTAGTRSTHFAPYQGNTSTSSGVNQHHQRVKLFDITIAEGDFLYTYITLMSRSGGSVSFNGLEIV